MNGLICRCFVLSLLAVSVASAQEADSASVGVQTSSTVAPEQRTVRVAWFGQTGGLSSQESRISLSERLYDEMGRSVERVDVTVDGPMAYARGKRLLIAEGGLSVTAFQDLLARDLSLDVIRDDFVILQSPFETIFAWAHDDGSLSKDWSKKLLPGESFKMVKGRLSRVNGMEGTAVFVVDLPDGDGGQIHPQPDGWEMRFTLQTRVRFDAGSSGTVISVARPFNEGARRAKLIQELRTRHGDDLLVLGAGGDLESFSFIAAREPDRQRPNTWAGYQAMGLDVLTPGVPELGFGLAALLEEAKGRGVHLLAANIEGNPIPGWVSFERSGIRILVVGLLSQSLTAVERRRALAAAQIQDPVSAVRRAYEEESNAGRAPDLFIVLGDLTEQERVELAEEVGQINVILGDFNQRGTREESTTQTFTDHGIAGHPIQILEPGRSRIGLLTFEFSSGGSQKKAQLNRLQSQAIPVFGHMPREQKIAESINRVRQAAYKPAQKVLVPDLGPTIDADSALRAVFEADPLVRKIKRRGQALPGRMTADAWRHLVARSLRDGFGADAAFLPYFEYPWALTGSISRLAAAANLGLPDQVVLVELNSTRLKKLFASSALDEFASSGIYRPKKLIRGRAISDRERYTLAISESLLEDPRFAGVFPPEMQRRFRWTGMRFVPSHEGQTVTARDAAIQMLAQESAKGVDAVGRWMRPDGKIKGSRWFLDLDSISLEANRYSVVGEQDGYSNVRETRVTTGTNSRLGARGTIGLGREGRDVNWVNRLSLAFDKAWYDEADEEQETADQIKASTEIQVPAWSLSAARLFPYANGAFISEFTPTETDGGAVNPRKKQVDGTIGLLTRGKVLKEARLATVLTHDFSSPTPDPQLGILTSLNVLYKRPSTRWFFTGEGRYYVPGIGEDDASELGIILKGRAGVDVPVRNRLSLGMYVDVFGYRGQTDTTRDLGASVLTGVALKYDERIILTD